jgi:prepilin-type N-terminal cleavage/methylation domain-containing protein
MPIQNRGRPEEEYVRRPVRDDSGFTLLEVMTTCLLLAIALGMAVAPWRAYGEAKAQKDAARELVAVLRNAQVRSVAELVTYRVDLTSTSATSYRITPSSGTAVLKQATTISNSKITYTAASFQDANGVTSTSVYFYPKGSASKGSVTVSRAGHAHVYTVSVEGLTARVSYTD